MVRVDLNCAFSEITRSIGFYIYRSCDFGKYTVQIHALKRKNIFPIPSISILTSRQKILRNVN